MSRLLGPFSRRRGRGTDAGQQAARAPTAPPAPGSVLPAPGAHDPASEPSPQRSGADEVVQWPPDSTPEGQQTATQAHAVPASQETLVEGTPVVEPSQPEPQPEGRTAAELAATRAATENSDPSAPAATQDSDPPAAESSDAPVPRAGGRRRGQARRRLRYLRRLREVQVRDLGGLVFDLHRFGRDRPDLVTAKLGALQSTDVELRALETLLEDRRPLRELREAGIGGECPRCGALHASDASFCSGCGAVLTARRGGQPQGAAAAPGVTEPRVAATPAAATEPPSGGFFATVPEEPQPVPAPQAHEPAQPEVWEPAQPQAHAPAEPQAHAPAEPPAREPAQAPAEEPVQPAAGPDGIPPEATPAPPDAPPTDAVTTQLYPGDPLHVRVVDDRQQ